MKWLTVLFALALVVVVVAEHDIIDPSAMTTAVAANPLHDVWHITEVSTNQTLATGQPLLLFGEVASNVYDDAFSSWALDEDGVVASYTPRDVTWSIDYTYSDATSMCATVEMLLTQLKLNAIKHPDRDEYAMPWQQYIINEAPAGALKDAILAAHAQKIADGEVRTKAEMIAQGW